MPELVAPSVALHALRGVRRDHHAPEPPARHPVSAAAPRHLGWVLVPCLADNVASARTIESAGGVLEGIREQRGQRVRRYWVPTRPGAA